MRKTFSASLLGCLVMSGCYTYTPVAAPLAGMEVRARLTAEAAARASHGLDEPILRYDGRVVAANTDTVALDVLIARASSGVQDITIRDTVSLRRADLQSMLERKLSPTRSVVFTLAAAAAAFGLIMGIDQVVGGTGEETDPPPPAFRTPFVVRFRLFPVLVLVRSP